MAGKSFTNKEDRFIIQNQGKLSRPEMALKIGRPSAESIRQRIEALERQGKLKRFRGFVKDGVPHPYFSEEEKRIIRDFYPSQDIKLLIDTLGRSEASIRYEAKKLGVKKGRPGYFSGGMTAMALGVRQGKVVEWIEQGLLKGNKSGRGSGVYQEWKIEIPGLHEFIRNHYNLLNTDRIKDKSLQSVIASTPAGKAVPISQAIKVLGISKPTAQRRIKKGKLNAYQGFGGHKGSGGFLWRVRLDDSVFQWFLSLTNDRAAEWLVDIVRLRNPERIEYLNILLKYVPERIREIRKRIKAFSLADSIVREFETSPEGERLKNLELIKSSAKTSNDLAPASVLAEAGD